MKKLIYCIALFISVTATAQENNVPEKLREYNFSSELLAKGIGGAEGDANFSFNLKMTSIIDSEATVEEAKYDPTKGQGERWILLSNNGKVPTKKETREFNKSHNKKEEEIKAKIDDSSWNLEIDNQEVLVYKFKYNTATLKSRYKFLADIEGKAYFNKTTRLLEKAEYLNVKPTKIKPFNATKFHMVVSYIYNESEEIYQVSREEISMDVKIFGKSASTKHINEYSDYRKI